jgi:protein-L-isoaspartate(D-aspartate) O-methyltransferase
MSAVDPYRFKRDAMVADQLMARGISSARVLHAMRAVERHRFVPAENREHAYDDSALPAGSDQTISQPYVVAYMTQLLDVQPQHRVLEIGTGTGYQTAILAVLAKEVFTIERIAELSGAAQKILAELGFSNIRFHVGDGSLGWPQSGEAILFDRILVTAGAPEVPPPLLAQLADGGTLVAPRGPPDNQRIVSIMRRGVVHSEHAHLPVRFVPLIGKHAWQK